MKARNFVWTIPVITIAFLSCTVLTLQSCHVPIGTGSMQHDYISIEKIYSPYIVYGYGIMLSIGVIVTIFTWVAINRLSKRLDKMGAPSI